MDVIAVIIFDIPAIFGLFAWSGYRFGQRHYGPGLFSAVLALYILRLIVTRLSTRSLTLSLNEPGNQWAFMAGFAGGDVPFFIANGALAISLGLLFVSTAEFTRLVKWVSEKVRKDKGENDSRDKYN